MDHVRVKTMHQTLFCFIWLITNQVYVCGSINIACIYIVIIAQTVWSALLQGATLLPSSV